MEVAPWVLPWEELNSSWVLEMGERRQQGGPVWMQVDHFRAYREAGRWGALTRDSEQKSPQKQEAELPPMAKDVKKGAQC